MAIHTPQLGRPHRPTAFSLVEVLIAIGIMGVGISMAAVMFPAAIKENTTSTYNSMSTMLCQNGLALVQANCYFDGSTHKGTVGDKDTRYLPTYDDTLTVPWQSSYGFTYNIIPNGGDNDFTIIVVATHVSDPSHTSVINEFSGGGTIDKYNEVSKYTPSSDADFTTNKIQVGTPIIDESGVYAIVRAVVGSVGERYAILDRRIKVGSTTNGLNLNPIYTVTEVDSSGNIQNGSPAIGVLVTRTPLRSK